MKRISFEKLSILPAAKTPIAALLDRATPRTRVPYDCLTWLVVGE